MSCEQQCNLKMSPTISKLAVALSKFQSSMSSVKKDSKNPFFKSKYASLASIWESVKDVLAANELAITQLAEGTESGLAKVTTILMHSSGEYLSGTLLMKPAKNDPQGFGSCITYARRYALSAILCVATEDDDDGNAASGRPQAVVRH